jgi:DNA polymerase (family 10)
MTNREIAAILFNISGILARQHGNVYRIRAYRRAARWLLRLRTPVADRLAAGKPLGIPGLGSSLSGKIGALATNGSLPFYDELCEELPEPMGVLLHIPGIGPALAERICSDLSAPTTDALRRAVIAGKIQQVWGVGPRRAAAIRRALGKVRPSTPPPTAAPQQLPLPLAA